MLQVVVDNYIEFNQVLKDQHDYNNRELATGRSLVSFVEKAFIGDTYVNRKGLQLLFLPIKETLLSETCNPLSESDFNSVLGDIGNIQELTQEQKDNFILIASTWKSNIRF